MGIFKQNTHQGRTYPTLLPGVRDSDREFGIRTDTVVRISGYTNDFLVWWFACQCYKRHVVLIVNVHESMEQFRWQLLHGIHHSPVTGFSAQPADEPGLPICIVRANGTHAE